MKKTYDLSKLDWSLSGWTPYLWKLGETLEIGASPISEIPPMPAKVPGSVQDALKVAGLLPDWNVGLNYRLCEWVEHRHWIYEANIPDDWIEAGKLYRLNCQGLDYCGRITVNGQEVCTFCGSHVPHVFDVTHYIRDENNVLRIIFELPPSWLGQFGYTSKMTEWKPRFNYTWDWVPRLVQVGIWDAISLEATDGIEIRSFRCTTDADFNACTGSGKIIGKVSAHEGSTVEISICCEDNVILRKRLSVSEFNDSGVSWSDIPIDLWWPNLSGSQALYRIVCRLMDEDGIEVDTAERRVGFRNVTWQRCEGAPAESCPSLCVINGRPVFLQGVNWTPILPNFADVTEKDYRRLLTLYRDLGINIVRVWGGATLEKEAFYGLCDEMGIMVWQEFPLSSSGIDNMPPDDQTAIDEMAEIAESYITRRQHHASLILWCGGNELLQLEASKVLRPVDVNHPMLSRLREVVGVHDPSRRFLPSSPCGPSFCASQEDFGKDIHWDVHGPWQIDGEFRQWASYWQYDDALFRSETGSPGASSAEMIRRFAGECDVLPATADNPLWRRTSTWWIEWDKFVSEHGRSPSSLEEYVTWSQERQKQALVTALKSCKSRFPKCAGFLVWMGHDCFPCTTNTSIVDFDGNLKPAASALSEIWRKPVC
ncbi:MAG: glycoside hydrolase family 2 protein [Armatimonadota bacterium]